MIELNKSVFGPDLLAQMFSPHKFSRTLEQGGLMKADDMITKCPSKYQSGTGAVTLTELLKSEPKGQPVKVVGYLKNGTLKLESAATAERFVLAASATGGDEISIQFAGTMPAGTKDGVQLVVGGEYVSRTLVVATDVARLASQ